MPITKYPNPEQLSPIFQDWPETVIWSCLQGVMGAIYTESVENPASTMAILGDLCFLAGKPDRDLVRFKPASCQQDFIIMVPQDESWGVMIEDHFKDRAKKVTRYAFRKDNHGFDRQKLQGFVDALDPTFKLQYIDEALFHRCKTHPWSRDLVSQYADFAQYDRLGVGMVVTEAGEPVAGASSYTRYREGIEIEIDTKMEYRRKGLATVCGAGLILACMDRNLYPSWDAQNLWSVALAEKLGYQQDHPYIAYEIHGF